MLNNSISTNSVNNVIDKDEEKKTKGLFTFLNQVRSVKPIMKAAGTIPVFSQAIVHLNSFLEEPLAEEEDEDIIKFWKQYTKCDTLKELALMYFCVPATLCPSERTNSAAGNIISDKRNRLTQQNMRKKFCF